MVLQLFCLLRGAMFSSPFFLCTILNYCKLWIKEAWGSPAVGRKAGVSILIHKSLPYTVCSFVVDQVRHKLTVHFTVASWELVITNVYAFNSLGMFFSSNWPLGCYKPRNPYISLGYFNSIMDDSKDKSGPATNVIHPSSQPSGMDNLVIESI